MRTLRSVSLASLFFLVLASSVSAQPEPGDVGVFFDLAGTQTDLDVPAFSTFEFYTIGFDLGDFQGFELSLIIPPEITLLNGVAFDAPFILCVDGQCGPQNWIIGLSACLDGSGVHPLTSQTAFYTVVGDNIPICIAPSNPSSVVPPMPGYRDCAQEFIPFGIAENGQGYYENGCAVVNATLPIPIGTQETSWTGVKTRFGD